MADTMKLINTASLALPLLLAACVDATPTEAGREARIVGLFGGQAVGQAVELAGAEAGTIYLPGAEGSRYVVIPFFAAEGGETRVRISVEGERVGGPASGGPAASLVRQAESLGGAAGQARVPRWSAEREEAHLRLMARQREELRAQIRSPERRSALAAAPRRSGAVAQNIPQVGEVVPIRVSNPASQNLCVNPLIRQGRVVAVTQRAIVVTDVQDPSLSAAQFAEVATEFDSAIHPVLVRNFGEPTDLDGNGRVIIFFTSLVNEIEALGFFFLGDLLPRGSSSRLPGAGNPALHCPASNEGEIFYIVTPDEEMSPQDVVDTALSTVAHEYQHLINASRRLYVNNAVDLEEVWLDEGLSHAAEELMFYQTTPYSPGQNLDERQILSTRAVADAFFRYGYFNAVRYYVYLEDPDEESLMAIEDKLETRGAIWSFLRYAADHTATDDAGFFRSLANSRISGLANLGAVLGTDPVDLMQTWTASVYADDFVSGIPDQFRQPSWNFRRIYSSVFRVAYPLKVHTLEDAGAIEVHLRGGGAAFIEVNPARGRAGVVSTTAAGIAPPQNLRVTALRVR
jgi:hypothetical protein